MVPAGLMLVMAFAFAKLVGPDEYGAYALAISASIVLYMVTTLWIRMVVVRELSALEDNEQHGREEGDKISHLVSLMMLGSLFAVTAFLLLSILVTLFQFPLMWSLLPLVAISQAWVEFGLEIWRSMLNYREYNSLALARAVLFVGTGLAGAAWWGTGLALVVAFILSNAASAVLFGFQLSRRAIIRLDLRFSTESGPRLHGLFSFGLPLALVLAAMQGMHLVNRLLLVRISSLREVGVYSLAFDLVDKAVNLTVVIAALAAYPIAYSLFHKGQSGALHSQLMNNFLLIMSIGAASSAIAIAGRDFLIANWISSEYRIGFSDAVFWLSVSSFLNAVRYHYYDLGFQFQNKTFAQLKIMSIMLCVLLVASPLLMHLSGATGAAIAVAGVNAAGLLVSLIYNRHTVPAFFGPFVYLIAIYCIAILLPQRVVPGPTFFEFALRSTIVLSLLAAGAWPLWRRLNRANGERRHMHEAG